MAECGGEGERRQCLSVVEREGERNVRFQTLYRVKMDFFVLRVRLVFAEVVLIASLSRLTDFTRQLKKWPRLINNDRFGRLKLLSPRRCSKKIVVIFFVVVLIISRTLQKRDLRIG